MAEQEEEVQIEDLIADVAAAKRAAAKTLKGPHIEGRVALVETANNVYPLLESILAKMGQMEQALFDVLDGGELLAPDTAAAILGAIQLGEQLVAFVTSLTGLTDIQRAEGQKLCLGFTTAAGLAKHAVESLIDEEDAPEGEETPAGPA